MGLVPDLLTVTRPVSQEAILVAWTARRLHTCCCAGLLYFLLGALGSKQAKDFPHDCAHLRLLQHFRRTPMKQTCMLRSSCHVLHSDDATMYTAARLMRWCKCLSALNTLA